MLLLVSVLMTVTILVYVFYPEKRVAAQVEKTRLDYLRERKEVLYDNLRDLNFEYRAGKYRDEEYEAERSTMEQEAAGVLAEIDVLEGVSR
jgi:hypothetical protein